MNEANEPALEAEKTINLTPRHELSPGEVFGIGKPPDLKDDTYAGDDDFFTNEWADVAFGD